jgi:hypothetical protein
MLSGYGAAVPIELGVDSDVRRLRTRAESQLHAWLTALHAAEVTAFCWEMDSWPPRAARGAHASAARGAWPGPGRPQRGDAALPTPRAATAPSTYTCHMGSSGGANLLSCRSR